MWNFKFEMSWYHRFDIYHFSISKTDIENIQLFNSCIMCN